MIHTYNTTSRSAAPELFKNYIKRANIGHQDKYNHIIKAVHVDAAKEFTGAPFKKICDKYGVDLYTSGTGHHQGNSIAERVIQTLMQSTLSMIYTANSPEREWTLAWKQAVYIYNRLPHKQFQELHCPLDKFNKSFPDYSRIKIFGCKAYVFNEAGGTRRKNELDYNRAHVRVFVGNTAQAHYKLLDRMKIQVTPVTTYEDNQPSV
jgi:transposase InsO family protein